MSNNKFMAKLHGEKSVKSVLEIKKYGNDRPFANMPNGSSEANVGIDTQIDHGISYVRGTQVWRIDGGVMTLADNDYTGSGSDMRGEEVVSGQGLWIDSTYVFPPNLSPDTFAAVIVSHPKFVINLFGDNLFNGSNSQMDFTVVLKLGTLNLVAKTFSVMPQANFFHKQFEIGFDESIDEKTYIEQGAHLTLQVICSDPTASARIYMGMSNLILMNRKIDADLVSPDFQDFDEWAHRLENVEESLDKKQDKLTAGNGIDIEDDTISTDTQFVITEDMFDIAFDSTKGVAPYSTSYGYTNITIHEDAGVKWVEGAMYSFVLDTKVATSANRNVRVRIGESGDWKPVMVTSSIASGSSVFIKAVNSVFFYKTTYQANGALHCLYDTNTTYTINYSLDAGQKKAGIGAYAVSRYSLIMEKPDGTWEKITDTSKTYSTGTTKTVNKRGFLLNQIRYYNYTTNYANGALMSATYIYSKSTSVTGAYSFNCGTAPGWAIGDYIYLVGTVHEDDGLFYLDETKWWDNKLPTTADGKLYIQLGIALTTTDSTFSLLEERPVLYYDDGIKPYGGDICRVKSVNGKDGDVVLTGEDIMADVSEYTDTVQGHLQTLHNDIKDIELFKFPNAIIIGEPNIDHGQVSGFSENDYLQFPFIVDLHNRAFQIDFCFTTGNNVTRQQNILDSEFGLALAIRNGKGLMAISHNGTSWVGEIVGTLDIQPNTTYYARLSWNRINYKTELSTDGVTFVADMNFGSTQSPYPRTMYIGGCGGLAIGHTPHPFEGTINLNYAYLTVAGNVIWQGMDDAGLATRADVSLDNLDAIGQAKFDAKQNKLVAGHNIEIDPVTNEISVVGAGGGLPEATPEDFTRVVRVNSEGSYELGPEQFTPNLFDTKRSDYRLDDASWLNADTFSWQSGAVYRVAYAHLLNDYETAEEHTDYYSSNVQLFGKVNNDRGILSGMYANTAYATMPFKTPTTSMDIVIKCHTPAVFSTNNQLIGRLTGNNNGLLLRFTSVGVMRVWVSSNGSSWNLISDGAPGITLLPDKDYWIKAMWDGQTYSFAYSEDGVNYTTGATSWANTNPIYCNNGLLTLGGDNSESYPFLGTIDLNESYSYIDGERFWTGCNYWSYKASDDGHRFIAPEDHDKLLDLYNRTGLGWYYIVDATNNRFKLPRGNQDRYIVKQISNATTWARIYSDGWVEQGGIYNNGNNDAYVSDIIINLPIPMADNKYNVQLSHCRSVNTNLYGALVYKKNNSNFTIGNIISFNPGSTWYVSGFSRYPGTDQKRLYFYMGNFSKTALENTAGWTSEAINGAVGRFNLQNVLTLEDNTSEISLNNEVASIYVTRQGVDNEITLTFNDQAGAGTNHAYTYEVHIEVGETIPTITWVGIDSWIMNDVTTPFEPNATSIFLIRRQNGKVIANYGGAY